MGPPTLPFYLVSTTDFGALRGGAEHTRQEVPSFSAQ
jgi:hypothetical protein